MSTAVPPAQTGNSQQAVIDAALVLLERMGLSPADLAAVPQDRSPVPTFAEYILWGSEIRFGCPTGS